ncbi:MAG: hypothetical protein ACJATI_004542 [Halioglobus sp.]|jgi:hypothetical protein
MKYSTLAFGRFQLLTNRHLFKYKSNIVKYSLPTQNINDYMSRIFTFLLLSVFLVLAPSITNAQIRPYDNGEIMVLRKGALQSDNYYSNNSFKESNQHSLSTLFRYGLSKNFQLQFGWSAQKDKTDIKNVSSETANIGLKIHLTNDSKFLPALSAIVSTNLTFDPEKNPFSPSINLLYEKSISSNVNANGNLQVTLNEQSGDFRTNYAFNLEADVTNWQTTYVGLRGNSDPFQKEGSTYQQHLEIGMLFWVYDGIVLYPFYDIGLNDSSGDIFNLGALFTLGK